MLAIVFRKRKPGGSHSNRRRDGLPGGAWALAILAVSLIPAQRAVAQGEIVPDADTVVLDHFNGSVAGTAVGPLGFAASLGGLAQAGVFGLGNYVRYSFPGWFTGEGTVEMWIHPSSLAADWTGLLNVNWSNAGSYPPAGHVLHFSVCPQNSPDPECPPPGNFLWGSFWPGGYSVSTTPIAAGRWTHVAVSWGPAGTKVYVDGVPEVGVSGGPSLVSTNYAYLNYWGSAVAGQVPFDGLIDEFHVSRVQRSDVEIADHAAAVVDVDIDINPGSYPNSVNPRGSGVMPVAILTTPEFDAAGANAASVRFGRTGTEASPSHSAIEDIDGDGDDDLVLHFRTRATGIQCGDTSATLTGQTTGGPSIEGVDVVRTVGCK